MTAPDILAAVAADPNLAPAFAAAIRPLPILRVPDEPEDYSDEAPIPEPAYADCAAADWWAGRTGR